ncbi:MAG: hypothetical protein OJF51_002414 [Nitrospira sp.]|jgi:hypothetical protein|nr:MAG: hypothetical protein OJF51_002414 [Nitrospira sp.]
MPAAKKRKADGKAASHHAAKPSQGTLEKVLEKYTVALQSKPESMSFKGYIPELQIKSALQEIFPDIRISGRRDWFCMNPLNIRRAYKELVVSNELESIAKAFDLLREIVLPCYQTWEVARVSARLLATGEDLGKEFHSFTLTKQQIESVMTELPDAQQAVQGILYMADMWPMHLESSESIAHFGWCLETMAQLFRDRGINKIRSLDIALGFSGSGRGHRSDRKKTATKLEWDENCLDIHLLHLAGTSVPKACARYVAGKDLGRKSASPEVFEKQYRSWLNEPVTSVRLHLGDPLAKTILSLPDVQQLLEERFPSHQ